MYRERKLVSPQPDPRFLTYRLPRGHLSHCLAYMEQIALVREAVAHAPFAIDRRSFSPSGSRQILAEARSVDPLGRFGAAASSESYDYFPTSMAGGCVAHRGVPEFRLPPGVTPGLSALQLVKRKRDGTGCAFPLCRPSDRADEAERVGVEFP